jgi:hypothetical protein
MEENTRDGLIRRMTTDMNTLPQRRRREERRRQTHIGHP